MKRKPKRRPDGRWQRRSHGKLFISSISQADADRHAKEYAEMIKAGMSKNASSIDVATYFCEWLPVHKAHLSDNSYQTNQHIATLFIKHVNGALMKDVTPSMIKSFYTKYFMGKSDSYIGMAKHLLIKLFDTAIDDRICMRNPAKAESAKPHKGTSGTHRAITEEERNIIHTTCTDHEMYPLVMLMLYSGLRPSEAMAIDVQRDIDFNTGRITMHKVRHLNGRDAYVNEKGKTAKAMRSIPLFSPLYPVLKNRIGLVVSYKGGNVLSKTSWEEKWDSYVSAIEQSLNGHRKRWHHRTNEDYKKNPELRKEIDRLIAEGKKEQAEQLRLSDWITFDVKAYDLRHSFCTWCCEHDVDMHVLINWMGHTSAKMIQQVYDHVRAEREIKEAEKLENSLKSSHNSSHIV